MLCTIISILLASLRDFMMDRNTCTKYLLMMKQDSWKCLEHIFALSGLKLLSLLLIIAIKRSLQESLSFETPMY